MSKKEKNIISIEDRIPKLKQARKKKANRRLITYLSIFFLLISIIVYLQSPLSYVKKIHITGNSFLSEDEIIAQTKLTETTNIWTVKKKDLENKLNEQEVVKDVKVKKMLPWTIDVQINEYAHVGYIQEQEAYYPVVGDGIKLSAHVEFMEGNAPLLVDFDQEEYLKRMAAELNELPHNILNLISEIHWLPTKENENKILLYMNDGYLVDGTIRNFASKMEAYPSIVAQLDPKDKGVIHLGVGAYFEKFPNN